MSARHGTPLTPRALQRADAAALLGVSVETFDKYVRDQIRVVYLGTLRLYLVADLEQFLQHKAVDGPARIVSDRKKSRGAAGTAPGVAPGGRA